MIRRIIRDDTSGDWWIFGTGLVFGDRDSAVSTAEKLFPDERLNVDTTDDEECHDLPKCENMKYAICIGSRNGNGSMILQAQGESQGVDEESPEAADVFDTVDEALDYAKLTGFPTVERKNIVKAWWRNHE